NRLNDNASKDAAKTVDAAKATDAAKNVSGGPASAAAADDAANTASANQSPPRTAATDRAPKYDTRISDLAAPSGVTNAPAASGAPVPPPTPATPVETVKPAPSTSTTAGVANAVQANGATTTPHERFAVQLAAFADDKGANSLAGRLKKGGYAAYTEPLKTSKGTLWRVRVGPYSSHEAAVAARRLSRGFRPGRDHDALRLGRRMHRRAVDALRVLSRRDSRADRADCVGDRIDRRHRPRAARRFDASRNRRSSGHPLRDCVRADSHRGAVDRRVDRMAAREGGSRCRPRFRRSLPGLDLRIGTRHRADARVRIRRGPDTAAAHGVVARCGTRSTACRRRIPAAAASAHGTRGPARLFARRHRPEGRTGRAGMSDWI